MYRYHYNNKEYPTKFPYTMICNNNCNNCFYGWNGKINNFQNAMDFFSVTCSKSNPVIIA